MIDKLNFILAACKKHNVQPGLHCGAPEYAKKAIGMGFTFVTVGGDTRFVTMGAAATVADMKNAPKPGDTGSPY
jgi:4-hydroxy-2-oxoheptanedioate aldolase